MTTAAMNMETVLANAARMEEEFRRRTESLGLELKGVLHSEMFFLLTAMDGLRPRQVVESGRARAQSTCVLAACLPETRIVSIEKRPESEDAPIAAERMKAFANIAPLFGNATVLLPALLLPDDVVVIDGPKHFRAVRLALRALATGKPAAVFIHDMYAGLPEREFIAKRFPEAFFSDHPQFVERFKDLDEATCPEVLDRHPNAWRPYFFSGAARKSYGPTFACIPRVPGRNYGTLQVPCAATEFTAHLARSVRRRLGMAGG